MNFEKPEEYEENQNSDGDSGEKWTKEQNQNEKNIEAEKAYEYLISKSDNSYGIITEYDYANKKYDLVTKRTIKHYKEEGDFERILNLYKNVKGLEFRQTPMYKNAHDLIEERYPSTLPTKGPIIMSEILSKFERTINEGNIDEALKMYGEELRKEEEINKEEIKSPLEYRKALSYVRSMYKHGHYLGGEEKLKRLEEDFKNGDYSELLKEWKSRKGPEFEDTLQFKVAWRYLIEKYPFRDQKAFAELRGQDNVEARRKNDIRNDLDGLRDLGYYEELLDFYRNDKKTEDDVEENMNSKQEESLTAEEQEILESLKKKFGMNNDKNSEQESQYEKEKKELLLSIFKEGGFRGIISMPPNKETIGGGFHEIKDEKTLNSGRFYGYIIDQERHEACDITLRKKGINEFAVLHKPLSREKYEDVEIEESSLFGLRKTKKQERRSIGKRPILHSELVKGGEEENCVPFQYSVFSPQVEDKKSPWIDYMKGGRVGQSMQVELLLPESVAIKLQKMMNTDPGIVREIASHFMRKKLKELYNGDVWEGKRPNEKDIDPNKANYDFDKNNPLCPPWEKWDKEEGGGRIYIPANPNTAGWRDEYVRNVKNDNF